MLPGAPWAQHGVVEIDTSDLGFDEVVDAVLSVVVQRVPAAATVQESAR